MRQSKTCGEPCAVCDGCIEAHDAELAEKLAFAESMTRGAFEAALANGDERDREKARANAAEARVAELEGVIARILAGEDPDGCRVRFDEARGALAVRDGVPA